MLRYRIWAGQQRVRVTVLVVATAALMTACSADEPQPSAELPPASSSSAEPTPELPPLGPKDFPVPDEARTQDEAGAEAFSRYYIDLLNHEQAKPTGRTIRTLSSDCRECLAIARRLDDSAEAGYRIKGGQLAIAGKPGVAVIGDRAEISFFANVGAVEVIDSEDAVVPDSSFPQQEDLSSGLRLTWDESYSAWFVKALTIG